MKASEQAAYFLKHQCPIARGLGIEAAENLDSIIEVPGVDVIFIGPYDLSQSLGVPGEVRHPLVEKRMEDISRRCQEQGVCVGTFADTPEMARKWRDVGVRYMAYSVDAGLFAEKCGQVIVRVGFQPQAICFVVALDLNPNRFRRQNGAPFPVGKPLRNHARLRKERFPVRHETENRLQGGNSRRERIHYGYVHSSGGVSCKQGMKPG